MLATRWPRGPMHAPTGSTFSSLLQTAIFVRAPASRLMALISTVPSKISGTSISNMRLTRPGCVRLIIMRGPRSVSITSTTYTLTCWPSRSSSPATCSLRGSVATPPLPSSSVTMPLTGSMLVTTAEMISWALLCISAYIWLRSASLRPWRMTCLAVCAAMRPKSFVLRGMAYSSPALQLFFFCWASSREISVAGSSTYSTTVLSSETLNLPWSGSMTTDTFSSSTS